jgi:hypothetical protein
VRDRRLVALVRSLLLERVMRLGKAPLATVSATLLALGGCSPEIVDELDVEDGVLVEEGKEDNFFSISAKEFVLSGTSRIVAGEDATEDEVKRLIGLKHVANAWFINQYLVDKERTDSNASYGGFGAMAKGGSFSEANLRKVNATTWAFDFEQLISGRNSLLDRLPLDGDRLTIEVGKPTLEEMAKLEINSEWYREAPWSAWNPATVPADKKETLELTVREETRSGDAWWDYDRLFADGKLDIDVYFGWDYHDAYHLKHSRAFYSFLTSRGFRSPVSSFDRYTRKSGPLTRTIKADGRSVKVEVRILYGKPGTETDPDTDAGGKVLEEEARASLKTRDVIVYSGHSGSFYGFALANWKKTSEGDLDDAEIVTAEMADKYQVIVAEGCDTYMMGQAFLDNPAKNGANVDVITTTTFSDASSPVTVERFFARLIEVDTLGRHRPRTVKSLLEDLDSHPLYGVHGLDDNPQLHPYGREDLACDSCRANADCGGPGNACITVGQSGKRCAAACTDDAGCPSGFACKRVASASTSTIYASMCVPADNVCR